MFKQLKTFGVSPNADFVLRIFDIGYLDVYLSYLQILAADLLWHNEDGDQR